MFIFSFSFLFFSFFLDIVARIMQTEGFFALYKGCTPEVGRGVLSAALMLSAKVFFLFFIFFFCLFALFIFSFFFCMSALFICLPFLHDDVTSSYTYARLK